LITDKSIKYLKKCVDLDISYCKLITDLGIGFLKKCKRLEIEGCRKISCDTILGLECAGVRVYF